MTTPTFPEALQAEVATLQPQHPILAGALDKAFTLVAGGACSRWTMAARPMSAARAIRRVVASGQWHV